MAVAAETADEVRHWATGINGITLHVAGSGPTTGPAVLLVHGFPETCLS
jgi:pimeloyl-ACP methyl ester carboxylesterase